MRDWARVNRQLLAWLLLLGSAPSVLSAVDDFDATRPLQRRPGQPTTAETVPVIDPNKNNELKPIAVADPHLPFELLAVPDRWRIVESIGVNERWFDPYSQNTLKADRPINDNMNFFNINVILDSLWEPRALPTPVAPQTSRAAGALDVFGGRRQSIINSNLLLGLVFYKGDTTFRPPDYEFRLTTVFNYNQVTVEEDRALRVDPEKGPRRQDEFIGLQEFFFDYHLRNVSDRYDFDSIRFGIQPFNADFRGFLYQDDQLGIRLFGNRHNNLWQYNLAWFRRLEKDINSGLNNADADLRDDEVLIANLYHQDFPVIGFTTQATIIHNKNSEDEQLYFDKNGFLQRPAPLGNGRFRNYHVTYYGINGDGHLGRLNLTGSFYLARGSESSGIFSGYESKIRAHFAAGEASMDFDYLRLRCSAIFASGDDDPFDDYSQGYDAIFENPIIAGADTSFWIRQPVPNIGGGLVSLSGRNGVLNALRSSKEQGQANFTNPGTKLFGIGADIDVLPQLRISTNVNHLRFDNTSVLQVSRQLDAIDTDIGIDASVAIIYRPFMSQNAVLRLSAAVLYPGEGFKALYSNEDVYSLLFNLILRY